MLTDIYILGSYWLDYSLYLLVSYSLYVSVDDTVTGYIFHFIFYQKNNKELPRAALGLVSTCSNILGPVYGTKLTLVIVNWIFFNGFIGF